MENKKKVLLIQGFTASKYTLCIVKWLLERKGYEVRYTSMCINTGFSMVNLVGMERCVKNWYNEDGIAVNIVGHSLGGIYARWLQSELPKQVNSVVCLASPHQLTSVNDKDVPTALRLLFTMLSPDIEYVDDVDDLWVHKRERCLSIVPNNDRLLLEELCYRDDEEYVNVKNDHFNIISSLGVIRMIDSYFKKNI